MENERAKEVHLCKTRGNMWSNIDTQVCQWLYGQSKSERAPPSSHYPPVIDGAHACPGSPVPPDKVVSSPPGLLLWLIRASEARRLTPLPASDRALQLGPPTPPASGNARKFPGIAYRWPVWR